MKKNYPVTGVENRYEADRVLGITTFAHQDFCDIAHFTPD